MQKILKNKKPGIIKGLALDNCGDAISTQICVLRNDRLRPLKWLKPRNISLTFSYFFSTLLVPLLAHRMLCFVKFEAYRRIVFKLFFVTFPFKFFTTVHHTWKFVQLNQISIATYLFEHVSYLLQHVLFVRSQRRAHFVVHQTFNVMHFHVWEIM